MSTFLVFYAKLPNRLDENALEYIRDTHVLLSCTKAEYLGELYSKMQGEMWSPNGEARNIIRLLGLSHTSMTVGDIALCLETGEYYSVEITGWKKLPLTNKSKRVIIVS